MSRKMTYLAGAALAVACILCAYLFNPNGHTARAGSTSVAQVQFSSMAPIFTDPERYSGSVGDTPAIGIANPSSVIEGSIQRLIITNTHTANLLCVYWVATASACGSSINCDGSGTDNGDLILPRSAKEVHVAGDLRTCVVAAVTGTTFHISRAKVE